MTNISFEEAIRLRYLKHDLRWRFEVLTVAGENFIKTSNDEVYSEKDVKMIVDIMKRNRL